MAKKKVSKKGVNKNLIIGVVVVVLLLIGVFWYFNNQKEVGLSPGIEGMPDAEMPPGEIPKGCPIDFRTCSSKSGGPNWCCANTEACGESRDEDPCFLVCNRDIEDLCFKDKDKLLEEGKAWCCPKGLCPKDPIGPSCKKTCKDDEILCGTSDNGGGYRCCPAGKSCVDLSVDSSGCKEVNPKESPKCKKEEQVCGIQEEECCPEGKYCVIPGTHEFNMLCCPLGSHYDPKIGFGCVGNNPVFCDKENGKIEKNENFCPENHKCCGDICCSPGYKCEEITPGFEDVSGRKCILDI